MIRFVFLFLFSAFSLLAVAQPVVISGKVSDKSGTGLAGVSVHLLNTNFGANTDSNGNFRISGISAGSCKLEFTAIGFATVNISVIAGSSSAEAITIQLSPVTTQLDAVVVTAGKKEETLQLIPGSVSSLSSRQIQEYRIWNTKDITAIIPNLYSANPGDGRNVTSIRGITSTSYDPAVATYVDGVNQFGLDTYIAQLFDVERIEVLRGPQGTLYGRNAMGGVINIITRQPTNHTEGFVETNFGNFGQQRYVGAVRTPLIKDRLFVGISAIYDHNGGFYTNQYDMSRFDRRHSVTGNYYLKFLANNHWSFTLNAKNNINRNFGAFPLAYQSDALAHPFQVNQDAGAQMVDNIFNASLSVNFTGNKFNFSSQSSWQTNYRYYKSPIDADFSPIDGVTIINNYGRKWNNVKVATQEFRFTSPAASSSKISWTAGSYLFTQSNPVKQAIHYGQQAKLVGAPDSLFSTITTSKGSTLGAALFGQLTYSPTQKLNLTAGMRYDYEHKKQDVLGEYHKDGDPAPPIQTRTDTSASASFHALSPKISLLYNLYESHTVYGTYSRGYRTGGLTPLGSDPSQPPLYPYKPEYSNNFEVGSKNIFFDNRMRANLSFFYVKVTDAQIPVLVLPDAITITSNAGTLTSKGVELELSSTPAKGLQVDFNGGLNDARYQNFHLLPNPDQSGKRQVFTSPVTASLALQYSHVLQPRTQLRLVIRGEGMYLGKKYFNYSSDNPIIQPGYGLLNLRTGIAVKGFEIMFWMRNAGNKKYIDYAYDFGAVHLGNPRNSGVTLRKNF